MTSLRSKLVCAIVLTGLMLAGCSDGGSSRSDESSQAEESTASQEDRSVARLWNEMLLESIRNDFARPTVHARNLFHASAAMFDAWSAIDGSSSMYLLGNQLRGYDCDFTGFAVAGDRSAAQEAAISYAAYRLIDHRFAQSPGYFGNRARANRLMRELGFDTAVTSTDYASGSAAALGNYIADCYIGFGLQDGSNEANAYVNVSYAPLNPPIDPELAGNPDIVDLDRWQPISLQVFIDQGGNQIVTPEFLGPEWGQVEPFALSANDLTVQQRDGFDYYVYHDPGPPPTAAGSLSDDYKWGFAMVAIWSSHLDPADAAMVDISPASLGNIQLLPANFGDYPNFYDTLNGGDASTGYGVNPATGAPYTPQWVPRGDYTRVLAEFWADGPDSETPPGHWFVILNSVIDHPQFERRMEGVGPELDALEWDVKAYFVLGGAMHDSAVAAWGIKGWYDYTRPLSAIRALADRGQSSDPGLPSYSADGLPLYPGYIELVEAGDPLAGVGNEHLGKIKLYAWRGPDYVTDPQADQAGVGWILAEHWWPYQRPTFVTPPFAGYISGHSTFSRAAAEVLTRLTGDPYFPGGMSGFTIKANDFLVFERGPSVDMVLQWATYRDASDQTSLSRLWGGIHPPADDIPGRLIGMQIGQDAFDLALQYFSGNRP